MGVPACSSSSCSASSSASCSSSSSAPALASSSSAASLASSLPSAVIKLTESSSAPSASSSASALASSDSAASVPSSLPCTPARSVIKLTTTSFAFSPKKAFFGLTAGAALTATTQAKRTSIRAHIATLLCYFEEDICSY